MRQNPNIHNKKSLKQIRRDLRNNPTREEELLWEHLKRQQLGFKIRRQHSIGPYIVDFYCAPLRLAIELDGAPHFTPEGLKKDSEQQGYLTSLNIKTLRFENYLVIEKVNEVLQTIRTELAARQLTTPPPPPESGGGRGVVESGGGRGVVESGATLRVVARSPFDLPETARQLWDHCASRKIFAFYGSLGAGKTALIRALCAVLKVESDVSSPTFAIVNEYNGERPVYHIDLYRLDKLSQALEIGIEEYMKGGNICFIEWPELVEVLLPEDTVRVYIEPKADGTRTIEIKSS